MCKCPEDKATVAFYCWFQECGQNFNTGFARTRINEVRYEYRSFCWGILFLKILWLLLKYITIFIFSMQKKQVFSVFSQWSQ